MNSHEIQSVLDDAVEAIRTFDDQAALVNSFPYPMELYELIHKMAKTIGALRNKTEPQDETEPVRYNRLAVEELSDRLSDAISENIQLAVELRARDELVISDNKEASRKFLSDVLGDIFNTKGSSK